MKTLIKPAELSKKFVIKILLLLTAFALIGVLASCGDDNNPTGNNNPPTNESPIITFDTLLVRGISGRIDSLHSAILTKSVRIDFNAETNVTSGSIALISFKYKQWQDVGNVNGSHSFTVTRDSSKSTDVLFQLFISADTTKYLKVFNAKVYKVN